VSTSTVANYPLVYNEPPIVRLGIVYNPFMLNDTTRYDLVYNQNNTLADYLDGLPSEATWSVAYNGVVADPSDWGQITPKPFSNIVIVRVPEGGRGGKDILRMVAMLAVVVAAFVFAPAVLGAAAGIFGAGTAAALGGLSTALAITQGGLLLAGSLLVSALIPAQSINPSSGPSSASYGINGPKNTAREGVPVPVLYGAYQIGGNVVDAFTRNIGDDQYLFMRSVLNDGQVSSISQVQLNGQDITTFKDVEYRVNLGKPGETPVSWFHEAIRLESVQQKVTTSGVVHRTFGPVDRLRVDVAFPLGMIEVVQKSGNKYPGHVDLVIEYQALSNDGLSALSGWTALPLEAEEPLDTSGGSGLYTVSQSKAASFTLTPDAPSSGTQWSIMAEYKKSTDTTWTSAGTKTGTYTVGSNYGAGETPGDFAINRTLEKVQWNLSFPNLADWEVRFTGGAIQDNTSTNPNYNSSTQDNLIGTANSLHVERKTSTPFRLTYQSSTLSRGRYNVRVRRTEEENPDLNKPTQCWVSDIGEIDNENVSYEGTAMLSLKIKMTDQISSQPTLTALVHGSLVSIYNDEGIVTSTAWSNNPADICMDVLLNPERGGGGDPTKVIWSKIAEWREYCAANDLLFNGVFDFVTTMWDALQSVARVGHAAFIPQGTKYTVAIDQPADPVMLFTGSNMYMDTFQKTWMGVDDRANEIQQQFFDEADFHKQKTIRLPDVAAQALGQKVKPASVSGFGITNATQATREAEYQARQNSYTRSSVTVDVPIEAIGLNIGDVALVQHDSIKYADGVGGRLEAGSTTTVIKLDRPVTMYAGNSYTLLVNTDSLQVASINVTSVVGNKLTVTGIPAGVLPRIRRLIQGSHDVEVLKIVDLGTGTRVISVDDPEGLVTGNAQLWDTDIILERPVVFVEGESTSVTLTTALPGAPKQFSNYMFGQAVSVKMPYRLRTIAGDDDLYRRTLGFVQYDERVYEEGSWGIPVISGSNTTGVNQVSGLQAEWDKNPLPEQQRIKVSLNWTRPETVTGQMPYGGANILLSTNNGDYKAVGTSGTTTWNADWNRGDALTFKVVAYDTNGHHAPIEAAPTVAVLLNVFDIDLDPPHALAYTVPQWDTNATANLSWTASTSAPQTYRVESKPIILSDWSQWQGNLSDPSLWPTGVTLDSDFLTHQSTPALAVNVQGLLVGRYVFRVRAEKGFAASPWAYLGVDIEAPGLPAQVTGLTLAGGTPDASTGVFTGLDASWTWDDILAQAAAHPTPGIDLATVFLDYQVQIMKTDGTVLRTDYTSSPAYAYTFAKNSADTVGIAHTTARRAFTISVTIRSKQGSVSTPSTMAVSNPPPITPTGLSAFADAQAMFTSWDECKEADYAGTVVFMGTAHGFTPADANRAFFGKTNGARIPIQVAQQYYVRIGHCDAFDSLPANISAEYDAFVPTLITADLTAVTDAANAATAAVAAFAPQITNVAKSALQLAVQTVNDRRYTDATAALTSETIGTLVTNETNARVVGDQAMVDTVALIGAKSSDSTAFIANLNSLKVSPTESLATRLSVMTAATATAQAAVTSEASTRASADSAQASSISTISAAVAANAAAITTEQSVRASADSSEATARTTLAASVGTNTAAISTEQTVRASADAVMASSLSLIGVKNSGGTAYQVNQATFLLDGTNSTSSVLSGLNSSIGSVSASVVSEATARVNGDSSNASAITSITSRVGAAESSVSTQATAINGLNARYGIAVSAGGVMTGIVLNADGVTGFGTITLQANRFALVDPNKGNPITPFTYIGGTVYMPNVVVQKLDANIITAREVLADNLVKTTIGRDTGSVSLTGSDALICTLSNVTVSSGPVDIDVWTNIQNLSGGSQRARLSCKVYDTLGTLLYNTPDWGYMTFDGAEGAFNSNVFEDRFQLGAGTYTFKVFAHRSAGGSNMIKDRCTIKITDNKIQS
jgi:predicted phage tail protein